MFRSHSWKDFGYRHWKLKKACKFISTGLILSLSLKVYFSFYPLDGFGVLVKYRDEPRRGFYEEGLRIKVSNKMSANSRDADIAYFE